MRWWRRVGGSGHLNVLKGHRLNVLKGHPGAPQAYLRRRYARDFALWQQHCTAPPAPPRFEVDDVGVE